MIVIIEGVNRTGKTTLVETLSSVSGFCKYYDRDFLFTGKYSNDDLAKMIKSKIYTQANMCKAIDGNFLFDRAHLSEVVYGEIDRGYIVNYQFDVEKIFNESNVKLVLCDDSIENINLRNGKDMSEYYDLMNLAYDNSILDKMRMNIRNLEDWQKLRKFLNL